MSPEREARLEDLFHRALAVAVAERTPWLARACGGDAELFAAVQELLRHHDQATPSGLQPQVVRPEAAAEAEDAAPASIDRYQLLERLGEGGMGVVWLAEQQQPVRRRVALKVMRTGLDGEQALQRFAAERQALARMEHPNIARIHDAGATPAGRPYYVMEYTPGPSLTAFCDQRRLDVDARLALFLSVVDAVQHAHQRGFVHRDLKPGNVLVTDLSGTPMAKVIDFGIARAMAAAGEATTTVDAHVDGVSGRERTATRAGDVLGTFDYMSPEQARGDDVDTRTDLWSLGVMLYELLAGVLPFARDELRRQPLAAVRQLLQTAVPPTPSTAFAALGAHAAAIAARRAATPAALQRRLRGDLDWIVRKAMAREREQRYASASELAADLRRHLQHEPVLAAPPGARYRLGKFVRRHRGVVAGAAAVLLAGGAGFAATWRAMQVARGAESHASARAEALRRQLYATNLASAQDAIERADVGDAQRLLAQCPADLRGFEWRWLAAVADRSRATTTLAADAFGATCAVWARGGDQLLLGCRSGELIAVAPRRGALLGRTVVADGPIVALATDRERRLVLVGTETGTWSLRDGATFGERQRVASPLDEARSAALSPDGRQVAILRGDQRVQLLDVATGTRIDCAPPPSPVELAHLRFRPDGAHVVAGGADLCVWTSDGNLVAALPEPRRHWRPEEHPAQQPRIGALAFDAVGQRLAVAIGHAPAVGAGTGNRLELRAAGDYALQQELVLPGRGPVSALAFAPDGGAVLSARDRELLRTELGGSWRQQSVPGSPSAVLGVAFGDAGDGFVSWSHEGSKWWPLQPAPAADQIELVPPWGRIVWSDDRRFVAVSAWALGGTEVHDTRSFELVRAFLPPHGPVRVLAFLPDGAHVVAADATGAVGVHALADGALRTPLAAAGKVQLGCLDAAGDAFVGADDDGGLRRHALATGAVLATAAADADERAAGAVLELLPAAGDELLVVRSGGRIERRERATLRLRRAWRAPRPLLAVCHDVPGAQLFAVAVDGGLWRLPLDGAAGECLGEVHSDRPSLAMAPDGHRLFVLDQSFVQVRDARDGRVLLARLRGGPPAASVVVRPDGLAVLTAGQQLGVFELAPDDGAVAARSAARRGRDAFARLKVRHGTVAAMRAHAADEGLDAAAQAVLQRRFARGGDSPYELNHEAWFRVLRPYLAPADYQFALHAAETAVRLLPTPGFQNTLATACLRAGEFARARTLAGELVAAADAGRRAVDPIDLAVLTMACARLGDHDAARASLQRLQDRVRDAASVADPQAWIFVREAEATMAAR